MLSSNLRIPSILNKGSVWASYLLRVMIRITLFGISISKNFEMAGKIDMGIYLSILSLSSILNFSGNILVNKDWFMTGINGSLFAGDKYFRSFTDIPFWCVGAHGFVKDGAID